MKLFAGLTGAAVLFTGVGVAQAQDTAVESKVTMSLVFNVNQATGTNSDTRIAKIRFNTKDLMTFVDAAAGGDPIKSVVHRRTTDADGNGVLAGADFLSETLIFLDADRGTVSEAGTQVVETSLDLDTVDNSNVFALASAFQLKENDAGNLDLSRRDVFLDSARWVLDLNGNVDATDQIELDLIGLVTANSRRRNGATGDAGLFLTSWSAPVNGGVTVDNAATALDADLAGFVTGTIKVSGEKALPQAQ